MGGDNINWTTYSRNSGDKYSASYLTDADVYWRGRAETTKEITLSSGGTIAKGSTKQLDATVKTKNGDGDFGADYNVNTGSGGTIEWDSSNDSVASVSQSGLITGKSTGTTTITVTWHKEPFTLTTTTTLTVTDGGDEDDGGDQPSGSGQCTPAINPPSTASTLSASDLDPNAAGVIKADTRGTEPFDVLKGIPTSESLYTNAFADNYLFKQAFAKMSGTITYSCQVDVTYVRKWTIPGPDICNEGVCVAGQPEETGDSQSKSYTFSFTRNYSYWQINNLEVYSINRATMSNYALPGGVVTMNPSGYSPPTVQSNHSESVNSHVTAGQTASISYSPPVLTGGLNSPPTVPNDTAALKGMAESNTTEAKVKNDLVKFNSQTIMDNTLTTKDGPAPSNLPNPSTIGKDVLYKPDNVISSSLLNKANTASSGTIYYDLLPGNVNGGADKNFAISGINNVTVHTPVVMYPGITDDKAHNQRITPNASRAALILDRPFTVILPTSGQHQSYPGYGDRDYAKYTAYKQVQFPFDVWNAAKTQYIQANTWIDIPVAMEEVTFQMPTWVDEGNYTVLFRSISENAPASFNVQTAANLNLANHAAMNTLNVEVIGRLYDFRVTDVTDYNWEKVFRTEIGKLMTSSAAYWVGMRSIDGDLRGNSAPYKLPIHPGSHPDSAYRNIAVKTGYTFRFDLRTKGNMFTEQDSIRITPSFDFVSTDGSTRYPVDLYYHSGEQRFIRIGSEEDTVERGVILNEPMRNIPEAELVDTALYRYDHNYTFNQLAGMSREAFVTRYIQVFAKRSAYEGTYHGLELTSDLRTYVGPKSGIPSSVNPQRALAAVQKWYGEYSLPAGVYVVKQGTDLAEYGRTNGGLSEDSELFLKNGYIIVNFDIQSVAGGQPRLKYLQSPLMNQWRMEGYEQQASDAEGHLFKLKDGDIVFYEAGLSSRDDFRPAVTH
ncbi:DUF5704 domain-containing protein [Paenibacillus pinistramenti]|uniref:DUF5704 domain-containing protein n=1 Tax=Paenibacillus pinistramenti TaxID=1768003 RepID=UPI001107CD9A